MSCSTDALLLIEGVVEFLSLSNVPAPSCLFPMALMFLVPFSTALLKEFLGLEPHPGMSDRGFFSDTIVLSIVGNFFRYYQDFDSKKIMQIFNKIAHAYVQQDLNIVISSILDLNLQLLSVSQFVGVCLCEGAILLVKRFTTSRNCTLLN